MNDLKSHFMMLLVGQSDGVKSSVILSDNQLDNDHTLPSSFLLFLLVLFSRESRLRYVILGKLPNFSESHHHSNSDDVMGYKL